MSTSLFAGAAPLLLFLAKATIVLIGALVATTLFRRGTAGERHLVWLAALVGVLALPLIARIPALQLGILPSALGTRTAVATPAPFAPRPAPVIAGSAAPAPAPEAQPAPGNVIAAPPVDDVSRARWSAELPSMLQTIAIVWGGVAFSLLGWLAFGAIQVRRIVANGTELDTPDWTTPLCEVADRLDLEQPPRLVMSDRIEMAFACRALTPTIVLPASAEAWTDDRRRAVLFHELAHVKRHDLVAHTLGRVACALYWFHPLVWTAARQLRAESEKACDDLVLSCGARPSEYAQHLLDMVTSVRHHGAPVMALPMARRKEFEGRMLAILDPAIRRAAPGRLKAAAVIAGVGATSLVIAAAAPASGASAAPQAEGAQLAAADTIRPRRDDREDRNAHDARDAGARAGRADDPVGGAVSNAVGQATSQALVGGSVARDISKLTTDVTMQTLRSLGLGGTTTRGQAPDTAKVAMLVRVLETDTDPSVRRAAAWGLHELPTQRAASALVRALASDADATVREMSAWALSESDVQASSDALATALLRDRAPHVRSTAAWALGQLECCGASDALVSAISDADEHVRFTAIWALGQGNLHRAPTALVNALSDNAAPVRRVAAWTIGQMEDTSTAGALTRAFASESSTDVKTAIMWAMTQIDRVPPAFVEAAMKSSDPEIRRRAVGMLAGNSGSWPWPWPWPWPRPSP